MECKLVIKDCNGLYIIYFTKLYKVLVGVINKVIIIFNFYIYKELFSFISLAFKIFYAIILNQKALEVSRSDFIIFNISCTLIKLIIYFFLLIKGVSS